MTVSCGVHTRQARLERSFKTQLLRGLPKTHPKRNFKTQNANAPHPAHPSRAKRAFRARFENARFEKARFEF